MEPKDQDQESNNIQHPPKKKTMLFLSNKSPNALDGRPVSLEGTQYFNRGVVLWARCEGSDKPCYEYMTTVRDWRTLVGVLNDVASRECSCKKRIHLELVYDP